jgi:hypothetical protein
MLVVLLMGGFVEGSQDAENMAKVVIIDKKVMVRCIGLPLCTLYDNSRVLNVR